MKTVCSKSVLYWKKKNYKSNENDKTEWEMKFFPRRSWRYRWDGCVRWFRATRLFLRRSMFVEDTTSRFFVNRSTLPPQGKREWLSKRFSTHDRTTQGRCDSSRIWASIGEYFQYSRSPWTATQRFINASSLLP